MTTTTKLPDGELLFVKLYVMLGDADGSIEGCRVLSKSVWDKDVQVFQAHLDEEEIGEVYREDEFFGGYHVGLDAYKTRPITREEALVLEKFLGTSQGDFRLPSEFIPWRKRK